MKLPDLRFETTNETIPSHTGLALIGAIMEDTSLSERLDKLTNVKMRRTTISNSDVVKAMLGMICLGKTDFADIEEFEQDPWFKISLGLDRCASEVTLRHRLESLGSDCNEILLEESAKMIQLHAKELGTIDVNGTKMVPLDIDESPQDNSKSKKEGVSRTYKGVDGYNPILAYLGANGFMINAELRKGSHHGQKNAPEFIDQTCKLTRKVTKAPILVRLDAGHDSGDNLDVLAKHTRFSWIIKKNIRGESTTNWLETAKHSAVKMEQTQNKNIYIGVTEREVKGMAAPQKVHFRVTETLIEEDGRIRLFPDIEVEHYWSNLNTGTEQVIELYHQHGTSEQFHAELKSDMGVEKYPSGKFHVNQIFLSTALFSFNCLRICGQLSASPEGNRIGKRSSRRKQTKRRRLRTVIQSLMYLASKVVYSGRRWKVRFSKHCFFTEVFIDLYQRLRPKKIRTSIG